LCADASTPATNKSNASLNGTRQYRKIIAERFVYHFAVAVWRAKDAESAHMKTNTLSLVLICLLAGFAFLQPAQAVVPPPDGGYPNFTTAEGTNALKNLTTGSANTAVGWYSLFSNAAGSFNTATGAGALLFNTNDNNTAFGAAALLLNTTGTNNTAVGSAALLNNTDGNANTAIGYQALNRNTAGFLNTANGYEALYNNTTGFFNTANGVQALYANTTGDSNTATGEGALFGNTEGTQNMATGTFALAHNTTGSANTANGYQALFSNTTGVQNTAVGYGALSNNTTAFSNTVLGANAGSNITGNGNVCIGQGIAGEVGVNDRTYIRNVFNTGQANNLGVTIGSNGLLGVQNLSARRFKEDVKTMDKTSEALFALRPVTFRYKKEVDADHSPHCGLIAEEVEKVNPDLVTRDENGHRLTVRYDSINAMLLNEFLKERQKAEQQRKDFDAAITQQQKQIDALTVGLQKVSAQLEASKPAPQMVNNP
jgi:hypothetical protein